MSEHCRIEFPGTEFKPLVLPRDAKLAMELTAVNSPILFGCRSGICGTCLVEVEHEDGAILAPARDELEALEIFAPGNQRARLACQMKLTGNLCLRKIESC
jgi:ferredoxin